MPFVQAKCPNCGGMLAVDDSKKAAICQFCGDAFVVEEAVNNYITYNVTNNTTNHNYGDGAVVNIYEDKSKDFVIKGGVLEKYEGASVDVVIPDGVIEIGEAAFSGLKIQSVVIPEGVKIIGRDAFANCLNLVSVDIPRSVLHVDASAFKNTPCNGDGFDNDDFVISNDILIGYKGNGDCVTIPYGIKTIGNKVFENCNTLVSLKIPDSVTVIDRFAFADCINLKTVVIGNGVQSIGVGAFANSTNLESVILGNSVTTIDNYAFFGCESLESITFPNSLKSIGECAFEKCVSLSSVVIPSSVTTIGRNAFFSVESNLQQSLRVYKISVMEHLVSIGLRMVCVGIAVAQRKKVCFWINALNVVNQFKTNI